MNFMINLFIINVSSYLGHVPTVHFQYGETFGNATQKYFNDYRNEVLNSSKSL